MAHSLALFLSLPPSLATCWSLETNNKDSTRTDRVEMKEKARGGQVCRSIPCEEQVCCHPAVVCVAGPPARARLFLRAAIGLMRHNLLVSLEEIDRRT